MNDTLSLLLATSILAVGGLGLYMYKSSDENQREGEYYNEDKFFGSGSLWDLNENENENENEDDYNSEDDEEVYIPKVRAKANKTKRRKSGSGTKRRY